MDEFIVMDGALQDIKTFLKKLECGQLEIEAGQWKLQKRITNLKESLEGIKELKSKVEEMKRESVAQEEIIRQLKNEIEKLKLKQKELTKMSLNRALQAEKRMSANGKKGATNKDNSNSKTSIQSKKDSDTKTACKKVRLDIKKGSNCSCSTNKETECDDSSSITEKSCVENSYNLQRVDEGILQRYLNDSVKHRNDAVSDEVEDRVEDKMTFRAVEKENTRRNDSPSSCATNEPSQEAKRGAYFRFFGSRNMTPTSGPGGQQKRSRKILRKSAMTNSRRDPRSKLLPTFHKPDIGKAYRKYRRQRYTDNYQVPHFFKSKRRKY